MRIRTLSYNIHKGFQTGGKRFVLPEIRELIRTLNIDIVFLQEVIGEHERRAQNISRWPSTSQYEYLADNMWSSFSYGKNAAYSDGHHGNAILSRFPIVSSENCNISTNKFEKRGFLSARVEIPSSGFQFTACCTHLDLTERGQKKQATKISTLVTERVPPNEPLILAGDFNDRRDRLRSILETELRLTEVVRQASGKLQPTFPAMWPLLSLDRVYVRHFEVISGFVLRERTWRRLSDHLPVIAELEIAIQ